MVPGTGTGTMALWALQKKSTKQVVVAHSDWGTKAQRRVPCCYPPVFGSLLFSPMPFSYFLVPKDTPAEKLKWQHRTLFFFEAQISASHLAQHLIFIAAIKKVVTFFMHGSFVDLRAVLKALNFLMLNPRFLPHPRPCLTSLFLVSIKGFFIHISWSSGSVSHGQRYFIGLLSPASTFVSAGPAHSTVLCHTAF